MVFLRSSPLKQYPARRVVQENRKGAVERSSPRMCGQLIHRSGGNSLIVDQHYDLRGIYNCCVDRYQYLILMGLCILGTLPLELVLGARVYRQPRRLLLTMIVPVCIFVVWDVFAIAWDHWSYTPEFVTGWELPGALPIEELTFFLVIPICGLLTLETVRKLRGR